MLGGGGKRLRSESHFHVTGAVHTLGENRERPEPDFSKYIGQVKQLLGLEWRFVTRSLAPHVPCLQWGGGALRLTQAGVWRLLFLSADRVSGDHCGSRES